jgi:hypothetical protein
MKTIKPLKATVYFNQVEILLIHTSKWFPMSSSFTDVSCLLINQLKYDWKEFYKEGDVDWYIVGKSF